MEKKRITYTIFFDDPVPTTEMEDEFCFNSKIDKEHAVVIQYLGLQQTVYSLKECEYYFRRFPFRGLPVTRYSHLTNVCEMYFSRFYEFRERMKKYFEALKEASPDHNLDIGKFIKLFDNVFDKEIRTRNRVHHNSRFEDVAIDRIFMLETLATGQKSPLAGRDHLILYRKVVQEWAGRVRRRGEKMDEVMEAIAEATLLVCEFLKQEV